MFAPIFSLALALSVALVVALAAGTRWYDTGRAPEARVLILPGPARSSPRITRTPRRNRLRRCS